MKRDGDDVVAVAVSGIRAGLGDVQDDFGHLVGQGVQFRVGVAFSSSIIWKEKKMKNYVAVVLVVLVLSHLV